MKYYKTKYLSEILNCINNSNPNKIVTIKIGHTIGRTDGMIINNFKNTPPIKTTTEFPDVYLS